jgi:predicted AlkP superfamily pyrophosphatase or phosphodiesterase
LKNSVLLAALATSLGVFAFAQPAPPGAPVPVPAKDGLVILVTIDGFPAWLFRDPTLVIPNLRRLAKEGAVADAMTVSNPSITWPNHTTLVTGVSPRRHGVLSNWLMIRKGPGSPPGTDPWRPKAELVRAPTIYDAAFKAGLRTAQVDWVAIQDSGTIHDEFAEVPKVDGPLEKEIVADGVVDAAGIRDFDKASIVWRDFIWTQAAIRIVEKHRPNLLLFHLLSTDSSNHQYGPGTLASRSAYAHADRLLGDLLAAVDRAGMRQKTTVIVTTDHGFRKVERLIYVNFALREAGLVRLEAGKVVGADAFSRTQGGMAFVYVSDPARRGELLPKLRSICAGLEGVAQVLDGADGPTLGMPTPAENPGMGDLVLYAKPGYAFKDKSAGNAVVEESRDYLGTHGYPASEPDLDGFLVAAGNGIRAGARLERIRNVDVAPTLAALLGVSLPDVEGRVLVEFLGAGEKGVKSKAP